MVSEREFVIRIGSLPGPSDRRDLLEFVLAAVSLDVRARVLVTAEALDLFAMPSNKGWRQLIEQDLVEVLAVDVPDGLVVRDGIRSASSADLAKLLEDSTIIEV